MPNFQALKILRKPRRFNTKNKKNEPPAYSVTTCNTNLQIVLNTQTNPYLNQATSKKYLSIFVLKISFDYPWHLKFKYPPPPWAFHTDDVSIPKSKWYFILGINNHHKHGFSVLLSQMSFYCETSCGIMKCWPFSQFI